MMRIAIIIQKGKKGFGGDLKAHIIPATLAIFWGASKLFSFSLEG